MLSMCLTTEKWYEPDFESPKWLQKFLHYIMDVPNIGYKHLEMTNLHYKIAGTHPLYLSIKALRYKILISTKRGASTSFFATY